MHGSTRPSVDDLVQLQSLQVGPLEPLPRVEWLGPRHDPGGDAVDKDDPDSNDGVVEIELHVD